MSERPQKFYWLSALVLMPNKEFVLEEATPTHPFTFIHTRVEKFGKKYPTVPFEITLTNWKEISEDEYNLYRSYKPLEVDQVI